MRDLILLGLLVVGAIYAVRFAWMGAVMSAGISLMSPHAEFGYSAASWPVAQVIAVCTLIGLLRTKERQSPFVGAPVVWLTAFCIWICITLPMSMYFDLSFPLWVRSVKIFVLVFLTLVLITDKHKLNVFIVVVVSSLAFYGIKGGLFTLATGGNYRVWGPGGFVEGNNELAVALVMMLPMVRYLHLQAVGKWAKRAWMLALILLPVTILGSHSRGALLGLSAAGLFLWVKSDKKILGVAILLVVGALALGLMPAHYWSRMDTIQTYNEDTSAMSRINAWWTAFNVAKSHFFGGGFDYYTWEVVARYAPDPTSLQGAHSIYFQMLGEHGFIGLFLWMAIGVSTWRTCNKMIKQAKGSPELKWLGDLGSMVQVSMLGFAVGGAFLALGYFDLPYYVMVMVVIALNIVRTQALNPATSHPVKSAASPLSAPGAQSR